MLSQLLPYSSSQSSTSIEYSIELLHAVTIEHATSISAGRIAPCAFPDSSHMHWAVPLLLMQG